jgi:hypothetical protein
MHLCGRSKLSKELTSHPAGSYIRRFSPDLPKLSDIMLSRVFSCPEKMEVVPKRGGGGVRTCGVFPHS